MSRSTRILSAGLLSCLASTAFAHHSVVSHFDQTRTVEIRGTVLDFKLRNPHASMVVEGQSYIDGVAQEPQPQRWEIESQSGVILRTMGITPATFNPGDPITVFASPNRQPGFRFVNSANFVDASGKRYSMAALRGRGAPEVLAPSDSRLENMTGIYQVSIQIAQTPKIALPLNAAGIAASESYDPKLSPANTCESMSFPDMFYAPYLFSVKVEDNSFTVHTQAYEATRTVVLDGSATATEPDGLFGTISGTRDGESVVLQSTGFPASRWGIGAAVQPLGGGVDIPSSTQKTLNERFSLSEDGLSLIYEYVLADPAYLTEPYEARLVFPRVPDSTPMLPYDCEVESAAMFSRTPGDALLQIGE